MRARTVAFNPALTTLTDQRVDWSDAACVSTSGRPEAPAWARACFQGAPLPMRCFLVVGWGLLLLEGSPRSDDRHIMGWPIVRDSAHTVLRRRSRLGILATLIFTAEADTVTFSSVMTFAGPLGRVVWVAVAPVHRWAVRSVLSHVAATVGRR